MREDIFNSIVAMDEDKTSAMAKEYLDSGGNVLSLIETGRNAMEAVGDKFEKGEYFLSELLLAGEMFKKIMELSLPLIKEEGYERAGKIVLGTVKDDIHYIGKDVFKVFAEAAGFEVIDLGVDVSGEKFVDAARAHNPDIVGMSCLITAGITSMKEAISVLKSSGLEDIKIIIGGGRVDEGVKQLTGADAAASDAAKGVRLCKEFLGMEG